MTDDQRQRLNQRDGANPAQPRPERTLIIHDHEHLREHRLSQGVVLFGVGVDEGLQGPAARADIVFELGFDSFDEQAESDGI